MKKASYNYSDFILKIDNWRDSVSAKEFTSIFKILNQEINILSGTDKRGLFIGIIDEPLQAERDPDMALIYQVTVRKMAVFLSGLLDNFISKVGEKKAQEFLDFYMSRVKMGLPINLT